MKKLVYITILLLFSIAVSFSCSSLSEPNRYNEKKSKRMKNIHFIPKEFNNIKLGYRETKKTVSFPQFPNGIPINTITISTPTKIICDIENSDFTPVVPVCVEYLVSLRRGLKYNKLSARVLHIRKLDQETIYSGEIVDKNMGYGRPIQAPGHRERERERMARVEDAQKYSDDELDDNISGLFGGNFLNINLMEYIDIPFKPGKYEIYLSFSGLESNRTIVEIMAK